MPGTEMRIAGADELQDSLIDKYYDLLAQVETYREAERPKNKKLLDELMGKIGASLPIDQWESELAGRVLTMGCGLAREAILEAEKSADLSVGTADSLAAYSDWLCSFCCATACVESERHKVQAAGQWVMSRLVALDDSSEPDQLASQLVAALAPLRISADVGQNVVRTQIVQRAVRTRDLARPFAVSEQLVREWCADLVQYPQFRVMLTKAAQDLGVPLPVQEKPQVRPDPAQPPVAATLAQVLPRVWPVGELALTGAVGPEFLRVLFALQSEAKSEGSALQQRTASQIGALGPRAEPDQYGPVFSHALNDLWVRYWSKGDRRALDLMARLAGFMWRLLTQNGAIESLRSNALHHWMSTQLPVLIRTADLPAIIDDAALLGTHVRCRVNPRRLRRSIVEAHAGECQRLKAAGENDELEGLRRDNGPSLRLIVSEFESDINRAGGDRRELTEIKSVWELIFPSEPVPDKPRKDDGRKVPGFLSDPGFSDVIRRGAVQGVKDWIDAHYESVQDTLQLRLNVHLNTDHLMPPYGTVFQQGGTKRNQPDPKFLEAQEALRNGDFRAAASIFGRLADRIQAKPRDIARSHQAYALARQGELLQARQYMAELCRAGYSDSAVHWNLACCIPAEDGEARLQQLQVLREGLRFAPHPQILDGAVFLSLWLQDEDRLREWLPQLTIFEALLILYRLTYEDLDFANRELAVQRLGQYVRDGEPVRPDPTDDRTSIRTISDYQNTLLDRHQAPAFEFWLACRELVARHRWDFWSSRTDFLDRTQRREEAARSFLNELNCRFGLLVNLGGRSPPYNFVPDTRRRTEQWLANCMTQELRPIGADIYEKITKFAEASGQAGKELLTRDRRIINFYTAQVRESAREENPDQVQRAPVQLTDLSSSIVRAARACFSGLHEVSHLPRVDTELRSLARALLGNGKSATAAALDAMLKDWAFQGGDLDRAERIATLQRARRAFGDLRGSLQRELTSEQNQDAATLLLAFSRVTDNLAKTLQLVPELRIEAVPEAPPKVDLDAGESAISIRVNGATSDTPVRITGATATLDDGLTELRLRNDLQGVEVLVDGSQSAVLSFGIQPAMLRGNPRTVEFAVKFELAGATYNALPVKLPVGLHAVSQVSGVAPYLWGRPLSPSEIDGHFFGRIKEQEQILESISNGQQRIRYVEGIRRSGKSSLLNSIIFEIEKRELPIIPVYISVGSVGSLDQAGKILYFLLHMIAMNPQIAAAGVTAPTEEACTDRAALAYMDLTNQLVTKLKDRRVVVLLDEFQVLVSAASASRDRNSGLFEGIKALLNMVCSESTPSARLLWVFAGQEAFRKFREHLPGALLWGVARALPVDFLDVAAVGQILQQPLAGTSMKVLPETIQRVHALTGGHPEVVQQMGELMWLSANGERRVAMTPADADEAAVEIAATSDGFADTWYPLSELKRDQSAFVAALINAVPAGGSVEAFRLLPKNELTDAAKAWIDDLVARKILLLRPDGSVAVRTHVLDLWLHRYIKFSITEGINGSLAIFIDVANLTKGTGSNQLQLDTNLSDQGVPGQFRLTTVIDRIEAYARTWTPAPVAARWVVNYPRRSAAVLECQDKDYQVENIPEKLFEKGKGQDDIKLREKMWDVEQGNPNVTHFLLVAGDVDYSVAIDKLLRDGKSVHLVGLHDRTWKGYRYLASEYSDRFTEISLEELLEQR